MLKILFSCALVGTLLSGCAVRHIVRDPNTGRKVYSSTERKSDQPVGWYKQVAEYQGRFVELWCHDDINGTICRP